MDQDDTLRYIYVDILLISNKLDYMHVVLDIHSLLAVLVYYNNTNKYVEFWSSFVDSQDTSSFDLILLLNE